MDKFNASHYVDLTAYEAMRNITATEKIYRHNDYLQLTKDYLRNYTVYQRAVSVITENISDLQAELSNESVKIASYGHSGGGGHSELNGVERAAAKRIRLNDTLQDLESRRKSLCRHLKNLNAAVAVLPEEDRAAVKMYYSDKINYRSLGELIHMSERTCRRRISKATRRIATVLFGMAAMQNVLFLKTI